MPDTPAIHTLTGNLLCERTLDYTTWTPGRTQRAVHEEFNARGKGVNVSNMLARLGTASTALIFAGGAPGSEAEDWLRRRGLHYHAFPTLSPSRTGTVIWSEQQPETTFLGPDSPPDHAAIKACAAWLDARPDGETLALCGSFPGWNSPDYEPLQTAIARWQKRGRLFADVYGPPLLALLDHPVELIKINRQEFDGMSPEADRGLPMADRLTRMQRKSPIRNWVVSNGPDSVWVLSQNGRPVELAPPQVEEVSPTGSGDVMFACVLHALLGRHKSLVEAVRYALPFAAANAAHKGVADFILPEVD